MARDKRADDASSAAARLSVAEARHVGTELFAAPPQTQDQADRLADRVADVWKRSPAELLALVLPTTSLEQAAPKRFRRSPRVDDIVTADDWWALITRRWQEVARWRERDFATWLNALIRDRVAVRPSPQQRPGGEEAALPTPRAVAQTLFYVGR